MPGSYSGEISATPGGGFVSEGPAAGFAAGVLGASKQAETGQVQGESTQAPTPNADQQLILNFQPQT